MAHSHQDVTRFHEAPSCLSALHAALGALVTENEAEIAGADLIL